MLFVQVISVNNNINSLTSKEKVPTLKYNHKWLNCTFLILDWSRDTENQFILSLKKIKSYEIFKLYVYILLLDIR